MMSRTPLSSSIFLFCVLLFARTAVPVSTTAPSASPSPPDLSGTWLVESATGEPLYDILPAKLSITGNAFSLTGYRGITRPWTGTFTLGEGGDKQNLDFKTDPFDIAPDGRGSLLVPPCTVRGVYKFEPSSDGDRLTICFTMYADSPRPATFTETYGSEDIRMATFVRTTPEIANSPPKEITFKVLGLDGNPVPNAIVANEMTRMHGAYSPDGGKTIRVDLKSPLIWRFGPEHHTAPDGTLHVPYTDFTQERRAPLLVRDPDRHLMALINPSAPSLLHAIQTIHLQPERLLRGQCESDALKEGGLTYWPTIVLTSHGNQICTSLSEDTSFNIPVAPGDYWLTISSGITYKYRQRITIPPGTGDFLLPPITLDSSELHALLGKPAPAIPGVLAWKNGPIDFPSLKGKVILLDFWGYWCGNCVIQMPTLMRLHDKYKDKGLAIVSVHVDAGGEVDTVEKLDARTAYLRNGFWQGRDVPFPTALVSGRPSGHGRSLASRAYGVLGYPTTIVIGRDGKVVGALGHQLHWELTDDANSLDANIEKLLATP
ncbi:MAG TPA: thioredoxin-like domain-containing protein [Phycisphaerae bacterium]|nr:thioredoxin-like domain-containing protein [Phycisphaerae bacterium]